MEHKQFSQDFKDAVITKIVGRGNQTITEICKQVGIAKSTGSRWVSECDIVAGMKKPKHYELRSAEAKLNAIIQNKNLTEEEYGAFLRQEGLHSHQIDGWLAEVLTLLGSSKKQKKGKDERDQRIRELEKELHRKDKALAEASALLILQKKVNLIWGKESGDEK